MREHGSGNAGATNMFRTFGWKPALFITLVDGYLLTLREIFRASLKADFPPLLVHCLGDHV